MRLLGQLSACLLAIVVGTVLGTIPIIKENMHWNFFFVIPISGCALGMGFGWVQFQISRISRARVGGFAALVMALACTVGYLGSDFGQYATTLVAMAPEPEVQPEPDALSGIEAELAELAAFEESEAELAAALEGEGQPAEPVGGEELVAAAGEPVPLSEVMTFVEFMKMRLASTSIDMRPTSSQEATWEIGATGATVSFFADLFGAWLGAFMMLINAADRNPYCRRCKRYKSASVARETPLDPELANETADRLRETAGSGRYEDVVSLLEEIRKGPRVAQSAIKLATDERVCPSCHEATLICRVLTQRGDDWKEALEVRVSSGSNPGASSAPIT